MAQGSLSANDEYYKAGDTAYWSVYIGGGQSPSGTVVPILVASRRLVLFTLSLPKKVPSGLTATFTSFIANLVSVSGSIDGTSWETQLVGKSGRTLTVLYATGDGGVACSYTSTSDMSSTTAARPGTAEITEYSITFS